MKKPVYKQNIEKLGNEFAQYNPNELCAKYAAELLHADGLAKQKMQREGSKIF